MAGGEEILITKHAKTVARLCPPVDSARAKEEPLRHPDYEARRKAIWGDRVFSQAEVEEMRAFETGEP